MIYLDNASTTRPLGVNHDELIKNYGNPSSNNISGQNVLERIEQCKEKLLSSVFVDKEECSKYDVVFTSCGSESNCLAILGLRYSDKKHIITSCIEHKAVLNACKELEEHFGFRVTYIPVDCFGFVNPQDVYNEICEDTALVSIMATNNELGTIQNIDEVAKKCRESNVLFHTDAVQSNFHRSYDGIDMISLSGHKFHSLKGVGCLIKRKDITLSPIIYGGSQQNNMRAGTENTIGIINMCENYQKYTDKREILEKRNEELKKYLLSKLLPDDRIIQINWGAKGKYSCNIISLLIKGIPSDALQVLLNSKYISISNGSACNSKSLEPSYVLTSIGMQKESALSTIRISLPPDSDGVKLDEGCLDQAAERILECINMLEQIFVNNRRKNEGTY